MHSYASSDSLQEKNSNSVLWIKLKPIEDWISPLASPNWTPKIKQISFESPYATDFNGSWSLPKEKKNPIPLYPQTAKKQIKL